MRKKRRVGEFREYSFIVCVQWPGKSFSLQEYNATAESLAERDAMLDAFLDFVESRDLGVAGFLDEVLVARLACCHRQRCPLHRRRRARVPITDADREAVVGWFRSQGAVAEAGPVFDAWHHTEAEYEAAKPVLA